MSIRKVDWLEELSPIQVRRIYENLLKRDDQYQNALTWEDEDRAYERLTLAMIKMLGIKSFSRFVEIIDGGYPDYEENVK